VIDILICDLLVELHGDLAMVKASTGLISLSLTVWKGCV